MKRWLLKTEPDTYRWDDLVAEGNTAWDGVKGGHALKNMAQMRPGEQVFIYHTGKEKQIVGIGQVVGEPYPDPGQQNAKRLVVDLVPVAPLDSPVTLGEIKKRAKSDEEARRSGPWEGWALLRIPRLSVVPVSDQQWEAIIAISSA